MQRPSLDPRRPATERDDADDTDIASLPTPALIAHLVAEHHAYLRKTLPLIQPLSATVCRTHGRRKPRLHDVARVLTELTDAVFPRLDAEESILFPLLTARTLEIGCVARELESMRREHLEVAQLLDRLRSAAEGFKAPRWACTRYRALFSEIEHLHGNLLRHIHTENHILIPRVTRRPETARQRLPARPNDAADRARSLGLVRAAE